MTTRLEKVLSALIAISALAVAGSHLYERWTDKPGAVRALNGVFVPDWTLLLKHAQFVGPRDARVTIVEFGDFECPFCRDFHSSVEQLRVEFPVDVSLAWVHFPLPSHQMALPASIGAECAAQQGRFSEMMSELFRDPTVIRSLDWTSLVGTGAIVDLPTFELCVSSFDSDSLKRTADSLGTAFSVTGTPTILVNGWRFAGAPPLDTLRRVIADLLASRKPY